MSGEEFGRFLRSRRERLTPQMVGLPDGARRRVAGLRRQEVAELAGIGIDWYIRLEQGRAVSPSPATVDALADVLKLDVEDRAHLRALARPLKREPFAREDVPEDLLRLLEGLPGPAYVTGRRWDILAWNRAASDLFGDFGALDVEDRNVLVYLLLDPRARQAFGRHWRDDVRTAVSRFRAAYDLWAPDPAFTALVERLRAGSVDFRVWWPAHDVRPAAGGRKTIVHPENGPLEFLHASFQSNDDPALRLVIYTPVRN